MSTPLLERFVGEARELLQGAATALLILEKNPGDEAGINEVFRSVHTLKGSAGLFDFPGLFPAGSCRRGRAERCSRR